MFLDGVIDFVQGLDGWQMLAYFWPFFLFDMSRYIALDLLLIGVYLPRRRANRPKRVRARQALFRERPLVSIIVPGKNEGKHIPKLAESLTRQTYKNIEIVVIDDGSDDNTAEICEPLVERGEISCFIRNEMRGGKASAANTALRYSKGKYIVHIDADSHLAHNDVETILLPFYMDPLIGAVGGDVRAANSKVSLTTRLQALEYMKAVTVGRTVSSLLGILRIIAGAHGAFRRDILERLQGWDVGPGLDGDITLKIRKMGYKVIHEPKAICYTNLPQKLTNLARQRYRWDRSMIRFRARKHKDLLLPSKNFRFANFISSTENLFFNLVLNLKWWVYIVQILLFSSDLLEYIFIINYALYVLANAVEFLIGCLMYGNTLRRRDLTLGLFVPLMPLYTGIYLRCVRTYAYLMEYLHRASYSDRWNPWKVSKVAKDERL